MTTMYPVQDGVPLAAIRAPKPPRRKWPVETMQPGQFFFVPGKTGKSVSAYVSRITKDLPGKYTARHCWAYQTPNDGLWHPCAPGAGMALEGVGVWRTE